MIKFVRGEAVSYNSNINKVIQVTLDLLNENTQGSPVFGYVVKRGDVLIIKDVGLNNDNSVTIWVYGSATGLRFPTLAEARSTLNKVGLTIPSSVNSRVTPTVYYKAHLNYHRALDSIYNAVHSLEAARSSISRLYSHLAGIDFLYPASINHQMIALDNNRSEYNLVVDAVNRYALATNSSYPNHLLQEDQIENIPPPEPDEDYPWDDDNGSIENPDPEEEEPLWNRLGFDSEDDLESALNEYYWDLLDDEGVEDNELNNSQRNSYRNRAFNLLMRDCTESKNKKAVINNGQMLKFKDLINVNIKGSIRPAICLADLPANINLETIVPVLYKYKDEYIKATIPYINIVNTLAKIEDIATRVKIKDFKESSDIFGYRKTKESVVGNIFSYVEIEKNFTCKKDGKVRDTIIVDLGKSDFRFVLSDVEFVLPQVNRVQLKKNKTIRIGSVCKIINNKGLNIPIGKKVEVLEVKATPQGASSKKLFRGSTNKRLDLATVKDIESGNTFKTYLKNLKFIQ